MIKLINHSLTPLFFTICTLLLLASCDVNDNDNFKKIYSYEIKKNASIVLDTTKRKVTSSSSMSVVNFTIEQGNRTVFIYHFKSIPSHEIADGGFVEEMVFQVPDSAKKFVYRDDKLTKAKTFYRYSCYCPGSGIGYGATQGVIKGKQKNPFQWYIQANVSFKGRHDTFTVQFEKRFTVKD